MQQDKKFYKKRKQRRDKGRRPRKATRKTTRHNVTYPRPLPFSAISHSFSAFSRAISCSKMSLSASRPWRSWAKSSQEVDNCWETRLSSMRTRESPSESTEEEEGGWEGGTENEVELAGLSSWLMREEEDGFLWGRVSKEGIRKEEVGASEEISVALHFPPEMVFEGDLPLLIGVPTFGNEHFFLLWVQAWHTRPVPPTGRIQGIFFVAQRSH